MKALSAALLHIFLLKLTNCFDEVTLTCELVNLNMCVNFDLSVANEQTKIISIQPEGSNQIKTLNLQSNSMHYLPMGIFKHFPQLEELKILTDDRRLMQIDSRNLKHVKNLKKIYITNQMIKNLGPKIFKNAHNLIELYLPSNKIETINSKAFDGLDACEILTLDHNNIKEIKVDVFRGLPQLTRLNLEGNKIKELPNTIFSNNHHFVVLELAGNLLQQIPVIPVKKILLGNLPNGDYYPTITLDDNTCPALKNINAQISEAEIMEIHNSCINVPNCMTECLVMNTIRRRSAIPQKNNGIFETVEEMMAEEERLLGLQFDRITEVIQKLESFLQDNPVEQLIENDDNPNIITKNDDSKSPSDFEDILIAKNNQDDMYEEEEEEYYE